MTTTDERLREALGATIAGSEVRDGHIIITGDLFRDFGAAVSVETGSAMNPAYPTRSDTTSRLPPFHAAQNRVLRRDGNKAQVSKRWASKERGAA